jgi:CRISPR-associated protein (TIGR03986 family)
MAPKLPIHTTRFVERATDNGPVRAHAPYNFVPLPQRVVTVDSEPPNLDRFVNYSGWIDCELETLSPTYVRGMVSAETFEKYDKSDTPFDEHEERARFFAVGERVTIPGSSLRGLIRAMVEIASFGKMQSVSDKQMLFRAVGDPSSLGQHYRNRVLGSNKAMPPDNHFDYPALQLQGGYLRQTGKGWAIEPAMVHKGESFVHVEYDDAKKLEIQASTQTNHIQKTHEVYVTPSARIGSNRGFQSHGKLTLDVAVAPRGGIALRGKGTSCPSGMVEATLVVSGHIGGKHAKHWHCAIYAPAGGNTIPIPDELWQVYEEDRDMTRGIPTRKLQKDGDALFYLLDAKGQLIFFGSTQMFRLPFGKSARDFVPPCLRREQDFDLAESIFGFVGNGDSKKEARAGRVFFCDARTLDGQGDVMLSQDIITPQILGTPKPSTFQHYLVQPDEAANNKQSLKHYASETPTETVIRGHKQYWHRGNVSRDQFEYPHAPGTKEREQAKKQLTGIRPVKHGTKFEFRVHFENLSKEELGALLWALDLPAKHAHKLGMGKPLGLGSVRITPTLHVYERASRYKELFAGDGWQLGAEQRLTTTDAKKAFEDYILVRLDAAEFDGSARPDSLADVPRIRELLCMLELPKNETDWFKQTRYMTIGNKDTGEENEYKTRPVLPLPSIVAGKPAPAATSAPIIQASTEPIITCEGVILKIDTSNTRRGRVRDIKSGQEYNFEARVIQGNAPGTKPTNSSVTFGLQGKKVVWLKRK